MWLFLTAKDWEIKKRSSDCIFGSASTLILICSELSHRKVFSRSTFVSDQFHTYIAMLELKKFINQWGLNLKLNPSNKFNNESAKIVKVNRILWHKGVWSPRMMQTWHFAHHNFFATNLKYFAALGDQGHSLFGFFHIVTWSVQCKNRLWCSKI